MTPTSFLLLSRASGADGEILSPPGFQFPVKELVASLSYLRGVYMTPLFLYNR